MQLLIESLWYILLPQGLKRLMTRTTFVVEEWVTGSPVLLDGISDTLIVGSAV
jgi:hypothetical protein